MSVGRLHASPAAIASHPVEEAFNHLVGPRSGATRFGLSGFASWSDDRPRLLPPVGAARRLGCADRRPGRLMGPLEDAAAGPIRPGGGISGATLRPTDDCRRPVGSREGS
ncbi:MAG: hypothetical protein AUI47_04530 [Acidobacteria bacterium 13_1_40CM_2_68_5]|nr:MAG: hypothetical protein AUI47_04530 [Acidobacteria bacterium 13_1_40CM_2_68_5]